MYSAIPKVWREDFRENVTLAELNNSLVDLHILSIIYVAILMIVGVLGNILVVYIYTIKYSPSTYRSFILWLGWIDLIACTVGMPLLIYSLMYPYMFPSEAACKTLRCLHVFFVVSSAFIVLGIAIERHQRIRYPLSTQITPTKIKIVCIVFVALGSLVALPAIFVYGDALVDTGVHGVNGTECFIDPTMQDSNFPQGYFVFQLLLCVISMVIIGIVYFRIGLTIMHHYGYIRTNTLSCTHGNTNKKTESPNLGDCIPEQVETKLDGSNLKTGLDEVKAHDAREETSNETNNKDAYSNQWISAIRKNDRLRSPSPGLVGHNLDKKSNKRICIGNRLETSRSSVSNTGPSIRTKQVTFMLFIITVVYVLSYIPHLVLMVTISIKSDFLKEMTPAGVVVYNLFLRSFVINNMANPIIYAFCDRKFRKECASVALNVLTCGRNS